MSQRGPARAMATGGGQHVAAGGRRAAQRRAQEAAEAALHRFKLEIVRIQEQKRELEEAVSGLLDGDPELVRRLLLIAPVIGKKLAGIVPTRDEALKGNVAKHALRLPAEAEGIQAWRRAQRGPRLEARTKGEPCRVAAWPKMR